MAGLWIHWEKGLVRKPEVMRIARTLGCTKQHAAACCMEVWEWAEDVTDDGFIEGITIEDVSFAAGVERIGEAMREAGWLLELENAVGFPNWDRHNGEPSKKRAVDAARKRVQRRRDKMRTLQGQMSE